MREFPPTEYAQRRFLYEDIESLLSPGFLSHSVHFRGVQLSFRSLYPSDFFFLQQRTGNFSTEHTWKVWVLASSTWMVNGVNLLEDPQAIYRMFQIYKRMPRTLLSRLFSLPHGLLNRVNQSLTGVEAYCYEGTSRVLWKQHYRNLPTLDIVTGVPGAQKCGMNSAQKIWVAFNQSEDERLQDTVHWEAAKLVASAHAPKGVEKIQQNDSNRLKQEDARRQEAQDIFFYQRLGLWTKEDMDREVSHRKQSGSYIKTVDDLEEEMRRWVAGEKDEHDKIVDGYKEQIRLRMEDEKNFRQSQWDDLQKLTDERERDLISKPSTALVGYTPEQLNEITGGHRPIRQVVSGEGGAKREFLYDRYLTAEENSGLLSVSDGKILGPKVPVIED